MNNYFRQERTRTVVRHVIELPVNWVEMQKLLRVVISDMGHGPRAEGDAGEPADDKIWYEVGDNDIALCYELVSGTSGGPSDSQSLR